MKYRLPNLLLALGASAGLLALTGCSHALEVKNLRTYQSLDMNPLRKTCTIGVVPPMGDVEGKRLVKNVAQVLTRESADVVHPYSPRQSKEVDVIATIIVHPEFKGSGWNFWINWPGYIIWAPAWHGYIYKADFSANIMLVNAVDNTKICSWRTPIKLDIRHAEMDRTWTEIGWLGDPSIPFLGGICCTAYDPDVTLPLTEGTGPDLGEYIAYQIINRLNSYSAGDTE